MMKKGLFLLLLMAVGGAVWAQKFSSQTQGGQTLWFHATSATTAEVTYPVDTEVPAQGWENYTMPTGAVTVPATVNHQGTTYQVTAIGGYAFFNCLDITSLTLPEGIVRVGNSACYGCSGLTTLNLPTTLIALNTAAFRMCTALQSLYLPASIDTLKNSCFADCSNLRAVTLLRPTPPVTAASAFNNVPLSQCTLYVASSSTALYGTSEPWSGFGTVMSATVTVSAGVNHTERGSISGTGTYSPGETVTLTAVPASGCFFACWNDGDTLNPRIFTALNDVAFTAYLFRMQAIEVHDTMELHDTVELHDTIRISSVHVDTVWQVDTVRVPSVHIDTIYHADTMYVTDTITRIDTVGPTYYRLTVESAYPTLGLAAGNGLLPVNTEVEIAAIPLEGARFSGWNDGNHDNPRRVVLDGNLRFTAYFQQNMGIDEVGAPWHATVEGRLLRVECPTGQMLRIYDSAGRVIYTASTTASLTLVDLPAAGTYLVRVGDGGSRKVVASH